MIMKTSRKGFLKGLAGVLGLGSFVGLKGLASVKEKDLLGRGFRKPVMYVDEKYFLLCNDMTREEYEKRYPKLIDEGEWTGDIDHEAFKPQMKTGDVFTIAGVNDPNGKLTTFRVTNRLSRDMQKAVERCSKNLAAEIDRELLKKWKGSPKTVTVRRPWSPNKLGK